MGENHCNTRLITGLGLGLQFGLCPAGFYIHIKDISNVLWALPTITHMSILLVLYLPENKRAENWIAFGRFCALLLASIALLIWSCVLPLSVGQYAGHNGLVLIAIIPFAREKLEICYRKHTGKLERRCGSEALADQPPQELRVLGGGGRGHRSDAGSNSSVVNLRELSFFDV